MGKAEPKEKERMMSQQSSSWFDESEATALFLAVPDVVE
jgi:hypothetical protein